MQFKVGEEVMHFYLKFVIGFIFKFYFIDLVYLESDKQCCIFSDSNLLGLLVGQYNVGFKRII